MKINLLIASFFLLCGCAPVNENHQGSAPEKANQKVAPAFKSGAIDTPEPAIALLAKRQAWCLLPETERLQVDAALRAQTDENSAFQRLILTTCAPEKYAKQSHALISTLDLQGFSEAERALLTLINDANRSLLQTLHERDLLRTKLRNTIDGISNIEAQIIDNETP